MDEPYENTNQRHDRENIKEQDVDTKIQKTENEHLAERTSESRGETSEGQALGGRRPGNQDKTSKVQVLGVRISRPDNQDETCEGRALCVRKPDNQDETSEEQALGERRPENQDETSEGQALGVRRQDNQDETSEEQALGVRRPGNQDETIEEQALVVRRPDNHDETSKEQALGVRRLDNQDETSEGRALGVRRPDNQDETCEEHALAIRRPDNQEQTGIVPFTPFPLQHSDFVQQIAGPGNIPIHKPTGCTINIYQSKECSPPEKLVREESSQPAADLCAVALKSVYKNKGSFIQMIPWVDDDKRHIVDIYTESVLETKEENPYFSQTVRPSDPRLKSYEDIFVLKTKESEIVKLTVFNGLPGRGKSTLFDKMAYDWAIGSVRAMQEYKLVVLLKMHALEQSSDLVDAMFDQLLADNAGFEKGDLQSYIEKNPEKVLILLDGFDELITTNLCESSFGSILKILNQKMFRGCRALVSTRPSHYDKLVSKQLVQNPFTHIRVLGFGTREVREYVHRFYSEEHDKAETVLAKIQSTDISSELAESPMLLLLMCLLWREDSELPDIDTMSRLYSEAVNFIFRRKGDVSEKDIARCVHEIGKVGLKGLLYPKQTLSFKEKDFGRDDLRLAIKVGILTSQKVLKKLNTYNSVQFIHKTFQEYCSGKYLKHLQEVDPGEFQKNLDQLMSLHPENFEFLLRFCCGDSEECTRAVFELLRARFPDKCSLGSSLETLATKCYVEGQSKNLVNEEFVHFLIPSHLKIEGRGTSTQRFLKCVAEQVKDHGSDCLAKVEEVRIEGHYSSSSELTKLLAHLKGCMSAMTNLKGLVLYGYSMEEKDAESGTESLSMLHKIEYLHFHTCSGGSKKFWSNLFKAMKNLHTLAFLDCTFTQQEVDSYASAEMLSSSTRMFTGNDMKCGVADTLVNVPNFAELNIKGDAPVGPWYMNLKQLSHLQKLSIVKCSLSKRYMELVAEAFSGLLNLEKLDLSGIDLNDSAALWAFQLQSLKRLQKINLSLCNLIGRDMKLIAEAMASLPYVKELNVSCNKGLRSSARLWSAHLRALKHLQKLNLHSCMLTEPDVAHVAEALCDLPKVYVVDLSGNKFLGGSGKVWYIHLTQVRHLRLSACLVEEANIKHFADTLGHLVKLVELDLSKNYKLGRSVELWCEYLRRFGDLQKLGLSHCSLNGGDMEHVLGSLCSLCNLTELDLSGNPCNDSGATWSKQLQLLVSLQNLKLSSCSLGGDAMNRILGSLSRLPNLVEVGFSWNRSLSGTAALWSNHFQQFNALQKLDLRYCNLTEDDEKVLRDSLMARRRKGLVITFR